MKYFFPDFMAPYVSSSKYNRLVSIRMSPLASENVSKSHSWSAYYACKLPKHYFFKANWYKPHQ
jgi:hypothetical protein